VWAAADVWCRYSLAVPGAVLAAVGLFKQSRRLSHQRFGVSLDMFAIGLAFLLYGVPGQVFVGRSPLPPSTVLNGELFMETVHFPVQLLRTVMASVVAIFTVRALRLFEVERQRQLDKLHQARAEAQQQLADEMTQREQLRRELLRQTVLAQEEERQHIARELHDEASQAMTAISWKLATVEQALPDSHSTGHGAVRKHIGELRQLTQQVMNNLRQLTRRLRPSVLDELGLVPALIAHADECSARFPFVVDVEVTGQRRRLPSEIETALYRITQEAITNVAKHAQAVHANVRLHFDDERQVALTVSDDGVGMDVENAMRAAEGKGWGVAGIRERVQLVAGSLDIRSTPGGGTTLDVRVPIEEPG
jgi:signal transduction histidine kinase